MLPLVLRVFLLVFSSSAHALLSSSNDDSIRTDRTISPWSLVLGEEILNNLPDVFSIDDNDDIMDTAVSNISYFSEKGLNVTAWNWRIFNAKGSTWRWPLDDSTDDNNTWTTWAWQDSDGNDTKPSKFGGGFLLYSVLQYEEEADTPVGWPAVAWTVTDNRLSWTVISPRDLSSDWLNHILNQTDSWAMSTLAGSWGFALDGDDGSWGFDIGNITILGNASGPGSGECGLKEIEHEDEFSSDFEDIFSVTSCASFIIPYVGQKGREERRRRDIEYVESEKIERTFILTDIENSAAVSSQENIAYDEFSSAREEDEDVDVDENEEEEEEEDEDEEEYIIEQTLEMSQIGWKLTIFDSKNTLQFD